MNFGLLAKGSSPSQQANRREQAVLLADLKAQTNRVAITFAPDGKLLATANSDGAVKVWAWDGKGWQERATLKDRGGSPVFSPDGKILASAGPQQVKLWDVASGKELASLQETGGTNPDFGTLAFSPDGKTLASGSPDRTVRLWDVATRQVRAQQTHLAPVYAVAFSPDGKTLASGSGDGTIKLWTERLPPRFSTVCRELPHIAAIRSQDLAVLGKGDWCVESLVPCLEGSRKIGYDN